MFKLQDLGKIDTSIETHLGPRYTVQQYKIQVMKVETFKSLIH